MVAVRTRRQLCMQKQVGAVLLHDLFVQSTHFTCGCFANCRRWWNSPEAVRLMQVNIQSRISVPDDKNVSVRGEEQSNL